MPRYDDTMTGADDEEYDDDDKDGVGGLHVVRTRGWSNDGGPLVVRRVDGRTSTNTTMSRTTGGGGGI